MRDPEMPLAIYVPTHPEARLTDAERDERGLDAALGTSGGGEGGAEEGEGV